MAKVLSVGIVVLLALAACTSPPPAPRATPTSAAGQQTSDDPFAPEYWDYMNRLLTELYRTPPVSDAEHINPAGFLVSQNWFNTASDAVDRLEDHGIKWNMTADFCYLFVWYIDADMAMRAVKTPRDFIVAEARLVERVRSLDESASSLILMEQVGEQLNVFPSEQECIAPFHDK